MSNPTIVLASTSSFRKALMQKMAIDFKTIKPTCDEESLKKAYLNKGEDKRKLCAYLAEEKALSISKEHQNAVVIGSDQSLFIGDEQFDKPKTEENAINQLMKCSNQVAELTSAVAIHYKDKKINFENTTKLYFKELTKEQIINYVKVDQPLQCAGSFMYEKKGIFLFEKLECSDPTSIEGLPMMRLSQELFKLGVSFSFL